MTHHPRKGILNPAESLPRKPLVWAGSSRKDIRFFPDEVQDEIGNALLQAQLGFKPDNAKPLRGFGGAGVLEVVADFDGDTYRAVYTVRFAKAVYVLHLFQKKSTRGISTPKHEIDLIRARYREAEAHYRALSMEGEG